MSLQVIVGPAAHQVCAQLHVKYVQLTDMCSSQQQCRLKCSSLYYQDTVNIFCELEQK